MILALSADTVEISRLYDVAATVLQQKLSQIEGVGQVQVGGSSLPAVRVDVNPAVLNKYGIGLDQVRSVLNTANANRPKGQLADGSTAWEISTTDQLLKAGQYRPLLVSYRQGRAVRLSDVADVQDSVENLRNAGLANGKPAVLVIIFRQPGANIIDTVDRVRALLPQLQASISPAINLAVMIDRTTTIRASIEDVELTMMISIGWSFSGVPLPARSLDNGIPVRRAALADWHLWSHVSARVQHRQPFAHGAHNLDRICGR